MANHRENAATVVGTPWQQHVAKWKDCRACGLCDQRNRIVLARGQVPCDVLLIGEAPGDSENAIGLPFKGPAGKLLDAIILAAGIEHRVAMTNLVACYPKEAKDAGTNEPDWREIEVCRPRLEEFVGICAPRLVVMVGRLAEQHLAGSEAVKCHTCSIAHPAAILRMPIAQKDFAIQRCIVTLSNAVETMNEPVTEIPF